ncbi:hypothetical protein DV737_g931, partial [Chaetothyriales sp. CBS 132003]
MAVDRRKAGWRPLWLCVAALCLWARAAAALATGAVAAAASADYFVHSLPGAPEGPLLKMHAGQIEVDAQTNAHMFFWLFHNRHISDRQRTVIWLNGGPGCSSMDGALMEIGPYRVREGGRLVYNAGSWDEFANIVFVDNPVGTGFSYVNGDGYLHELQEMADYFIVFLEKWFGLFPELEHDDVYLAGESYAGQHIPYIAKTLQDRNSKVAGQAGKVPWNLKGLLIGNGWISPPEQYRSYLQFAYDEGLLQGGTREANEVEALYSDCLKELNKPTAGEKVDIYVCERILTEVLRVTQKGGRCINMYDIRLTDDYPSCGMAWPPDLADVQPYLRQKNVTDALHINHDMRTGWVECNGKVSSNFRASHSKPSRDLLPALLESGLRILLFSGAKDYICNHLGTEDLISNLHWSGATGLELSPGVIAPRHEWLFEGQSAGYYQEARNLTYLLIHNSSHMVPFDYPRRTRDMLDRFIGVDIAGIGGKPADSQINGEKAGPETSVDGHPNSTAAVAAQEEKLRQARLDAYYRSGEAALAVVLAGASICALWVCRGRGQARAQGYVSVPLMNDSSRGSATAAATAAATLSKSRDLEAADFDENELDELHATGGADQQARLFDVGSDAGSENENDETGKGEEKDASSKEAIPV